MKKNFIILFILCSLLLAGCGAESAKPAAPLSSPSPTAEQTAEPEATPTEAQVEETRAKALEGMSETEIERLQINIAKQNLRLEKLYFEGDFFHRLSDPDDFYWNYLDSTGEIQIGWAYKEVPLEQREGWTAEQFLNPVDPESKAGVRTYNEYDAAAICQVIEEMAESVNHAPLKGDLLTMSDLVRTAQQTHEISYLNDFFKMLHDMDYFLLRYGPKDVGENVLDASFVSTFYDSLSVYH